MPFQVLNVPETRKLIKQIPVCRDIRWKENSEVKLTNASIFKAFVNMHPLAPPFLNRGCILCHRIDLRNQVLVFFTGLFFSFSGSMKDTAAATCGNLRRAAA